MIGIYLVVLCCFSVNINAQYSFGVNQYARIEDYPYEAGVYRDGEFICGGILIDESKIITPAHCIKLPNNPERYSIRAGSSYVDKGIEIQVAQIKIHPEWIENIFINDVAVLVLASPLPESETIRPIPLANVNDVLPNKAVVSGWGPEVEENPKSELKLESVELQILSKDYCERLYPANNEKMACATNPTFKDTVCKGDSGSALVYAGRLYGILVRSKVCGAEKDASLFSLLNDGLTQQFILN